jgi:hypothetical protein
LTPVVVSSSKGKQPKVPRPKKTSNFEKVEQLVKKTLAAPSQLEKALLLFNNDYKEEDGALSFETRISFKIFLGRNNSDTIYNNCSSKEERIRFVQMFLDGKFD